jgi:hypothetical protein
MNLVGFIIGVAAAVIATELTDISPWIAIRLVRWAAAQMYRDNPGRAARRRKEWEALIRRTIPTKISTLVFGLGFGCGGLYCFVIRQVPVALGAVLRRIRRSLPSSEKISNWVMVAGVIALDAWINSLQGVAALLAIGGLVASIFVLGWLNQTIEDMKVAKRRRLSKVAGELGVPLTGLLPADAPTPGSSTG